MILWTSLVFLLRCGQSDLLLAVKSYFPGGHTLPYFYIVPPYSIRASFSWGDTLQLTAHSWETVDASGMIDGDDNWQLLDGNYGAIVMMALPLCTMQVMMTMFRMIVDSGN